MSIETMKRWLAVLEAKDTCGSSIREAKERAITEMRQAIEQAQKQEALDRKAENARELGLDYEPEPVRLECVKCGTVYADGIPPQTTQKQEPVAWISVKEALPKAVRGVSYKQSLTDVVLVLHTDRPDYPITAHAVVGEGLGAGISIPTDGASEHPEIAWYSQCHNLNNPFDLRNGGYDRFLPKIFGSKITHWMPIPTAHGITGEQK